LESKGLSLSFVLAQIFFPNLVEMISVSAQRLEDSVQKKLVAEQWQMTKFISNFVKDATTNGSGNETIKSPILSPKSSAKSPPSSITSNPIQLSESARWLYTLLYSFTNQLSKIITLEVFLSILIYLYIF
jgi:hypothetical protein